MKQTFKPDFQKFVTLCCCFAVCALILLAFLEPDLAGFWIALIAGSTAVLILDFYLAMLCYNAASDKGYPEKKYFFISFFFGLVGYLIVIALPNKRMTDIAERYLASMGALSDPVNVGQEKSVRKQHEQIEQCFEGEETSHYISEMQIEYLEDSMNYLSTAGLRGYLKRMMNYPEMREHYDTLKDILVLPKPQMREALKKLRDTIVADSEIYH